MPTIRWLWQTRYTGIFQMALGYQAGYHGVEWQQNRQAKFYALSVDYDSIISGHSLHNNLGNLNFVT